MLAITKDMDGPVRLSAAEVANFRQHGFTYVTDICGRSELVILRGALERLFREQTGLREGTFYDMVEHERTDTPRLPTIAGPSNYAPELRNLPCLKRATAIARCLLGDEAVLTFEHSILKPARYGAPTPWHQDEAYRLEPGFRYDQVSFWIPLDDATVESGCLHYVPTSNLGEVLPHRSHNNNSRTYALECAVPVPDGSGIPVPVKAGDCTLHAGRTLHYAGPNQTDGPRYAYILEFEVPPLPLNETREFSWHQERHPPNRVARGRWLRRGGIIIEIVRRLRAGTLIMPARLRFEWRRCVRAFSRYFLSGA
jgi:hypothetical protein